MIWSIGTLRSLRAYPCCLLRMVDSINEFDDVSWNSDDIREIRYNNLSSKREGFTFNCVLVTFVNVL